MTENTEPRDLDDNMRTALFASLIGKAVQAVTVTVPADALTGDYLAHLVADMEPADYDADCPGGGLVANKREERDQCTTCAVRVSRCACISSRCAWMSSRIRPSSSRMSRTSLTRSLRSISARASARFCAD